MMLRSLLVLLFVSHTLFGSQTNQDVIQKAYMNSYNYEQMGNYKDAIKALAPVYKHYPNGYTLNLRYGWLFYLKHNYADAQKYYQKASTLKPYAISPRLGLANIYLTTASYDKVQTIATEILKTDYYNYYANLYFIKALIAQQKYTIAQQILLKMLTLYPTDVAFLEQLARIYKATSSPYFKQLCKDILILDPNNVLVRSLTE